MEDHPIRLSQFFLEVEPAKREKARPGVFRVLDDMKNNAYKPHTQQKAISKHSLSTSSQSIVVNQQKQSPGPSSTSRNSSCSDSVKSMILKLNAAKQKQGKVRRKTVPPMANMPQNKIPTASESAISVQSTSILEQMFMSNIRPVSFHHVKNRKRSVEAPCAISKPAIAASTKVTSLTSKPAITASNKVTSLTSKSAITTSNKVTSSSIQQLFPSNSGKPAITESQPPRPVASRQRSVEETRVTPQVAITGSSKVAASPLEEWFMTSRGGPLRPVPSRRRSAEEACCVQQVPGLASHMPKPSGGDTHRHIQSTNNLSKSLQNVGSEAPTSKQYREETSPSPALTILRLRAGNNKVVSPNHKSIKQEHSGHTLPLRAKYEKSPSKCKSRKLGGEDKSHTEDSHPVDTEKRSEVYQPPQTSKRIPSISVKTTNAERKDVCKRKYEYKKSSKSSYLSKKHVLDNHSRSAQKMKQSHKIGLDNMEVQSRKPSDKYSQDNEDQILKSAKKKTKHTASKKNSNSKSQRDLGKSSKKSVGYKRAASSKDHHSQSRKRIRRSSLKSENGTSDEDDSGLRKSHPSGGSIFTLSELEHACNTLVPFSEIRQLEERLHHGPVTASRHVTGSHSGLGSIFDARIHPGGIWKSIVDEG